MKTKHLERKYIQLHNKYSRMPDKNSEVGKKWALKLNEMYKKLQILTR